MEVNLIMNMFWYCVCSEENGKLPSASELVYKTVAQWKEIIPSIKAVDICESVVFVRILRFGIFWFGMGLLDGAMDF